MGDPVTMSNAPPFHKRKAAIKRSVLAYSMAFMCLLASSQCLWELQSSLNAEIGIWGMCATFGASFLSSILLTSFLLRTIGNKWSISVGMGFFVVWCCANIYPTWSTLIPTSVLSGLGYPVMYAAVSTLLTILSVEYADITDQLPDKVMQQIFGIFFMIHMTGAIWGNVISSIMLGHPEKVANTSNITIYSMEAQPLTYACGADFCFGHITNHSTSASKPSPSKGQVTMLLAIYICIGLAGLAIIVFGVTDPKPQDNQQVKVLSIKSLFQRIRNRKQLLLAPLTIYMGLAQAFYIVEYPQSFVSCAIGVQYVGYAGVCRTAAFALGSIISGYVTSYVGRIPVFLFAGAADLAVIIGSLIRSPDSHSMYAFFLIAAAWGLGDAIFQVQLNAFYGYLFIDDKEIAFAYYRMWEALAMVISLAYSTFICTDVKLYILMGTLIVGLITYIIVELLYKREVTLSHDHVAKLMDRHFLEDVPELVRRKSWVHIPESTIKTAASISRRRSFDAMPTKTDADEHHRLIQKRRHSLFFPLPIDEAD